ncbi:MAG: glucose 1-dehydrogenase [Acidimicrobiales bacterium]|jgi:NAD(P)-dependent dehydrogenase (short-subunit alcohol dehydrogenase family)
METKGTGSLEGRRALVTGGVSGIGLGITEAMLQRGMRVVVTGINEARGQEIVKQLQDRGDVWFLRADVEDETAIRASVDEAVRLLGGLDALVNNAGVALEATLLSTPLSEFDRLFRINVHAVLSYVQAAHPHLTERKGGVVNIGSDAALFGEQAIGAYSVSKAALVMMSRLLALDLAPDGIRCNCVCPGLTFPGMRHVGPVSDPAAGDDPALWGPTPLGRFAHPSDVAAAVLFFLSDDSACCTGTELLLDGGLQAGVTG